MHLWFGSPSLPQQCRGFSDVGGDLGAEGPEVGEADLAAEAADEKRAGGAAVRAGARLRDVAPVEGCDESSQMARVHSRPDGLCALGLRRENYVAVQSLGRRRREPHVSGLCLQLSSPAHRRGVQREVVQSG